MAVLLVMETKLDGKWVAGQRFERGLSKDSLPSLVKFVPVVSKRMSKVDISIFSNDSYTFPTQLLNRANEKSFLAMFS